MGDVNPSQVVPYVTGGAFLLAFIFGAVGNKTQFCTMGAVSDWVNMGELSRMRMWLLAIAVAVLGSAALHLAGAVDLSKSIYPGPNFTWLSYLVGGFLFGIGMTLGSGCGSKTLIRLGGGNLKAVTVYAFLRIAEDPTTLQEAFVATNSGRMESFSFVSPMAYTLDYLMLWTDKSKIITYGIASAAGVIAGSAAYAIAAGKFRWEGFRDAEDTAMHMLGGALM